MPRRELPPRFHLHLARRRRVRSLAATFLGTCLLVGAASALALATDFGVNARASLTHSIGPARTQIAAAASSQWLDRVGEVMYRILCPIFDDCPRDDLAGTIASQTPHLPPAAQPERARPATSSPPRTQSTQQPVQQINQPVIERVVETVRTVSGGVTEETLNARLAALAQNFDNRLSLVSNSGQRQAEIIFDSIGESGGIGRNLDDLTISGSAWTGGTITNATISGGSVTATAFNGTLPVARGGTGTSAIPIYGQLLLGNASGNYDLVATSSLGIAVGGSGIVLSGTTGQFPYYAGSGTTLTATSSLSLAANGNVGIGTTTPSRLLTLNGLASNSDIEITNAGASAGPIPAYLGVTSSNGLALSSNVSSANVVASTTMPQWRIALSQVNDTFQISRSPAGGSFTASTLLTLTGSGNLGVSSTSPYAKLSIHATNGGSASTLFAIASSTASATTTHLVVTNAGNVGIGTTTPARKLSISTGAANTSILIDFNSGNDALTEYTEAGSRLFRAGTVGAADRYAILDADSSHGVALDQNSGSWVSASDARLKENVEELSVLDRLEGYRTVGFDWKSNGKRDLGVIAQELYPLFPELVSPGNDDATTPPNILDGSAWTVMYDKIGPLALQGVKELNLKVEDLANTSAQSTEGTFTTRFFSSLFARLTQWFADTANGIANIISDTLTAREKLCVGSTCVTEDQFIAVFFNQSGGQSAGASAPVIGEVDGATSGTTTSEDAEPPTNQPDNDTAMTTVANDNNPIADAVNEPEAGPEAEVINHEPDGPEEQSTEQPELQPANDNPPPPQDLPATGTN